MHIFVEFFAWYEYDDGIHLAMEYFPHGDLERYTDEHGSLNLNATTANVATDNPHDRRGFRSQNSRS